MFYDTRRHAVRELRTGVITTLAGGHDGLRDGPAADASFAQVLAVGLLRDGRVAVVDLGPDGYLVRAITSR